MLHGKTGISTSLHTSASSGFLILSPGSDPPELQVREQELRDREVPLPLDQPVAPRGLQVAVVSGRCCEQLHHVQVTVSGRRLSEAASLKADQLAIVGHLRNW